MHQFNHMKLRTGYWFLLLLILPQVIKAQSSYTIPAYTAYALPAEEMNDGESKMFSKETGLQNWTNANQKLQFFFRIRAIGQKTGLITNWGGGAFGFMRSLALLGPLTVPQIAQMRPTSRQRMQRLADELAGAGLVEFVDNPKHRRSRLVRLTPEGAARYRDLNAEFLLIASSVGITLGKPDIRTTTETLRRLSDAVKTRSELTS